MSVSFEKQVREYIPTRRRELIGTLREMPNSTDFDRLTSPLRRELLVHCYRMTGSVHDAEDLLQETLLRAWRALDDYDETRASLRTWLYRIATNVCLTALRKQSRRPLPSGLVGPSDDPRAPMVAAVEVPWLQPLPDDPADVMAGRVSLRLALVAALQLLPARQRAMLILREVLDWSAVEIAEALETTPAAVNSGLQRARARISDVDEDLITEDPGQRELVDKYVEAFENADVRALSRLVTHDAILEMPPVLNWYAGRDAYAGFIDRVFAMRGTDWRMIKTSANGQPAVAAYVREDGVYRSHTLQVLTVTGEGVRHNVVFQIPGLFEAFGLPGVLSDAG
jgi:RNA polymerase sigma-70 factor (TIGR02960 family)